MNARNAKHVACALLLLLSHGFVQAQMQWQSLPTVSTVLLPSQNYVVCQDTLRGRTRVMDAGWFHAVFDGVSWQGDFTAPAPAGSRGLAYDPVRDRTVLAGGATSSWSVWEHDGTSWSQVGTSVPFSQTYGFVWHAQRQRIVSFGSTGLFEWDGTVWTPIPTFGTPPPTPPSMHSHDVVYDDSRNVLVVVGRVTSFVGAVWEWDVATGWQARNGSTGHVAVRAGFDSARGVVVCIARGTGLGDPVLERRTGITGPWTLAGTTPAATLDGPLTYDPGVGQVLVVSDALVGTPTFAYRPLHPARYESVGTACAGSQGVPHLRLLTPSSGAWIGKNLDVVVDHAPTTVGVLVTGLSAQAIGSLTLPVPLASIGMPGCVWYVSTDLLVPMVAGSSGLTSSFPVPLNGNLLGFVFHQQALVLDPGTNAFGAVVSQSRRALIGSQ